MYRVLFIFNNFRIASDKKMHEVVVMSDVISRLATTLSVDSVIDLVKPDLFLFLRFVPKHGDFEDLIKTYFTTVTFFS